MGNEYSTFDLAFRESEGRLAIWYKSPSGIDYLVDPLSFFNAIAGDKGVTYFLVRDKKNLSYSLKHISSHLIFEHNACLILVDDGTCGNTEVQKIPVNDFLTKTKACFIELHKALKSSDSTYYENDVKEEELSLIVQQHDSLKTFISTDNPYREPVNVEHFCFKENIPRIVCEYVSECEIPIDISIGNRTYKASYNSIDDLDMIRHQLEVMSYDFELGFRLEWDYGAEGVDIRMKRFQAGYATRNADGSFSVVHLCKVAIFPSDDSPAIIGICDPRQVIREIYEAMLNVGRNNYFYVKGKKDKNQWYCDPMAFYNKMKSNIIENYINKVDVPYEEVVTRQTFVKNVYTICPDYGNALFYDRDGAYMGIGADDILDFGDAESDETVFSMKLPGIYDWQESFEHGTDCLKNNMGMLSSEKWNRHGLALAQQIRQQLPDEFDLWYEYPFEDEENRGRRPILIYKDFAAIKAQRDAQKTIAFNKMALLSRAIKTNSDNIGEITDKEQK